ncbi:hypothetical protein CPB85DRAFT_1232878 [Mucidula mucida]|nr:hypothetical protein CPB85DRAFT_1232878 [Mucidula mucida]
MSETEEVLQKVEHTHPTLNGKRVGIQTYAASKTQYLTTAEDMPKDMEKKFDAMIHKFFWEHKTARVNKQTLKRPLDEGGQNLIDIKLWNDTIHIVHLATFLGMNGATPRWALVMQDTMRNKVLSTYKALNPGILVNMFLQTWDTNKIDLPPDMKRILKVAKNNKLLMDAIMIPQEVKGEMPIWLHQGWSADRIRRTNDKSARCLQSNHNVRTAEDARRVAEGESKEPKECDSQIQCRRRANQLLDVLDPKWDPQS